MALIEKNMGKLQDGHHYHDALSIIMNVQEENGKTLTKEEVKNFILEFIFAGTTTTRSTMTSLVMQLGTHPEVVAKILQELQSNGISLDPLECPSLTSLNQLTYLNNTIKETLRMSPPIGGSYRKVLQTMEIGVSGICY